MIMSKQGSTLQPQLQRISIKMIIQVQSLHPQLEPPQPQSLPQSLPPKNLLNIIPPNVFLIQYVLQKSLSLVPNISFVYYILFE